MCGRCVRVRSPINWPMLKKRLVLIGARKRSQNTIAVSLNTFMTSSQVTSLGYAHMSPRQNSNQPCGSSHRWGKSNKSGEFTQRCDANDRLFYFKIGSCGHCAVRDAKDRRFAMVYNHSFARSIRRIEEKQRKTTDNLAPRQASSQSRQTQDYLST